MTFCVNVESNDKQMHFTHHNKMEVAKWTNKTTMECARNMRHAQGLDLEIWAEAVNTTVYIKNWCPTKALDLKTPQEAWIGRKPDVSHLKVFSCKTYVHIHTCTTHMQGISRLEILLVGMNKIGFRGT
jgi:hypothetical protein